MPLVIRGNTTLDRLKRQICASGRQFYEGVLDAVIPPRCNFCEAPLETAKLAGLCSVCEQRLVAEDRQRCLICGQQSDHLAAKSPGCPKCPPKRLRFDSVSPLGTFENELREAVYRIKQPGTYALAESLAKLLWTRHRDKFLKLEVDVVVPVPMYWSRRIRRGMNNPEVLARRLASKLGTNVAAGLLVRRRNTLSQLDLSPNKRFENLRHAMRPAAGYVLSSANVLLVDDVMTTGATCDEAARVLKKFGAARVDVAVIARTEP